MSGYAHLRVERTGPVATVTMNRPERANALSHAHLAELDTLFASLQSRAFSGEL